jgi:hypothetical protein
MKFHCKYWFLASLLSLVNLVGLSQAPPLITISQGKFVSEGKPWFALTANYQVDVFTDDETTYWVGPHHGYNSNNQRCCNNQLDARMALFSDFAHIKDMGFNTIRICGLELKAGSSSADKKLWLNCKKGASLENVMLLSSKKNNKILASMAKIIVEEAQDAGLQIIFLTGAANLQRNKIQDKYNEWLEILCDSLKKTAPIFAIDIYNEPIYSSSSKLNKNELYTITKKWTNTIKSKLPKTLTTIGLIGPEDVGGWDPEVITIDFVSYHLYPRGNDFEYVVATMHWISQTSKKPWMIGETGYSGTDDSTQTHRQGDAAEQYKYAEYTLNRSQCEGAQGYSWWVYHDVFWGNAVDNMGLIDHNGKEKPIVSLFKSFDYTKPTKPCPLPDDLHYYRMEYSDFVITGIVEDESGKPLVNAVVCGWDADWKNFRWTVTQKNGSYSLGSNTPIKFLKISALGYSFYKKTIDNMPKSINLKTLVLNKLILK